MVDAKEIAGIEDFDNDTALELQTRAREYVAEHEADHQERGECDTDHPDRGRPAVVAASTPRGVEPPADGESQRDHSPAAVCARPWFA